MNDMTTRIMELLMNAERVYEGNGDAGKKDLPDVFLFCGHSELLVNGSYTDNRIIPLMASFSKYFTEQSLGFSFGRQIINKDRSKGFYGVVIHEMYVAPVIVGLIQTRTKRSDPFAAEIFAKSVKTLLGHTVNAYDGADIYVEKPYGVSDAEIAAIFESCSANLKRFKNLRFFKIAEPERVEVSAPGKSEGEIEGEIELINKIGKPIHLIQRRTGKFIRTIQPDGPAMVLDIDRHVMNDMVDGLPIEIANIKGIRHPDRFPILEENRYYVVNMRVAMAYRRKDFLALGIKKESSYEVYANGFLRYV